MTDNERPGFGSLLRQYRSASGLTQEDLAQATGLSVRGISALETGNRSRPHWHTVQQLAEALHLEGAELMSFRTAARESGELGDEDGATGQDGESLSPDTSLGQLKTRQLPFTLHGWRGAAVLATLAVLIGALTLSAVWHVGSALPGYDAQNRFTSGPVHFVKPMGVAVGPVGQVYASDKECSLDCAPGAVNQIVQLSPTGAGGESWNRPFVLVDPAGIALDSPGNLYVAEPLANQIIKISPNGKVLAQWGSQGQGQREFDEPAQVAVNAVNHIFVADTGNHRIKELGPSGRVVRLWGSQGQGPGQFEYPSGVALDDAGNVYVADTGSGRIQKFSPSGGFRFEFGMRGSGEGRLRSPQALAVAHNGSLYVADSGNNRIVRFSPTGKVVASWGGLGPGPGEFDDPVALAVAADGNLYVADAGNARVQEFTASGRYLRQWGRRLPNVRLCVEAPARVPGMGRPSRAIFNAVSMATSLWRARLAAAGLNLRPPIILDETFRPGQAVRNAKACVARRDTFGFIGPISSSDALVEEPILNRAAMLTVSPENTEELLTDPKYRFRLEPATYARKVRSITYFRTISPDQSQGAAAAKFMRQTLNIRTYYSVDDASSYGRSIVSAMKRYDRARLGLQSLGASELSLADPARMHTTIQQATRAIRARNPDGVYCACDVSVASQFARSLRLNGYAKPLVLDDAAFEGGGAWASYSPLKRIYGTSVDLAAVNRTTDSFSRSYRALFHVRAEPAALPTYEAAGVALAALYTASKHDHRLRTAESMRAKTLPYVASMHQRQGQKDIAFDRNGDLQPASVGVFALTAGRWRWHFLRTVHP